MNQDAGTQQYENKGSAETSATSTPLSRGSGELDLEEVDLSQALNSSQTIASERGTKSSQENGVELEDLSGALSSSEAAPVIDTLNTPIPFTKEMLWNKAKELFPVSMSVTVSFMIYTMLSLVLLMFAGRHGEFAGAVSGLSNFWLAATGIAFTTGLLGAADTLESQAFGAGNLQRVSIIFQRSIFLLTLMALPVAVLWLSTTPVLIWLRQDPEVSKAAGTCVLYYLPSLPFMLYFDSLRRYLLAQGIAQPTLWATAVANVVCIGIGYGLILHTNLSFYGVSVTLSIANVLQFVILVAYTLYYGLHKPTWRTITVKELLDWNETMDFFKLGVPGAATLMAEWVGFELHGIFAGWISTGSLAAQAILLNTNYFAYSFSFGLATATSVLVGNYMGSGRYEEARLTYRVAVLYIEGFALLFAVTFWMLHSWWGYIFTNAESVISIVSDTLPIMAFFMFSDYASAVGSGACRGVGQQNVTAISNLIGFYGVGIPVGYFFGIYKGWGLSGLWMGIAMASWCATVGVNGVLVIGDWKKWAELAKARAAADALADAPRNDIETATSTTSAQEAPSNDASQVPLESMDHASA